MSEFQINLDVYTLALDFLINFADDVIRIHSQDPKLRGFKIEYLYAH